MQHCMRDLSRTDAVYQKYTAITINLVPVGPTMLCQLLANKRPGFCQLPEEAATLTDRQETDIRQELPYAIRGSRE
jgi:hypothetical protein